MAGVFFEFDFRIWKYIPKKYHDAIDFAHKDSDGYWVYLKQGYRAYDLAEDCGIIHTYTIKDMREDLKTIRCIKEGA